MATNPYDRRNARDGARMFYDGMEAATGPRPSTIQTEDLDALVASAVDRALVAERASATARHADELLRAQWQAWEDGHAQGLEQGRDELYAKLGPAIAKARDNARGVFAAPNVTVRKAVTLKGPPAGMSKAGAFAAIKALMALIDGLDEARKASTVTEDIPF